MMKRVISWFKGMIEVSNIKVHLGGIGGRQGGIKSTQKKGETGRQAK